MSLVFDMNKDPADYHENEGNCEQYVFYKMRRRHLDVWNLGKYLESGGKLVIIHKSFYTKICYKDNLMSYSRSELVLPNLGIYSQEEIPKNYILFKAI